MSLEREKKTLIQQCRCIRSTLRGCHDAHDMNITLPNLYFAVSLQNALRKQCHFVDRQLLQRLRRQSWLRLHHLPIGRLLRIAGPHHDHLLQHRHQSFMEIEQKRCIVDQQLIKVREHQCPLKKMAFNFLLNRFHFLSINAS